MSDVIQMGQKAERLLADEAFQQALSALENRYIRQWQNADSAEEREVCHARISVLKDFTTEISKVKDDGIYEEAAQKRRGRPPKNPKV